MGSNTTAESYASVAIGRYNVGKDSTGGSTNPTVWVTKDPVFEVGVGTSEEPKNAMTIYKDGSAEFNGNVTLSQAQGDISMGVFGN